MFEFIKRILKGSEKEQDFDFKKEEEKLKESFLWWCEVRESRFYGLGGVDIKLVKLPMFVVVSSRLTVPHTWMLVTVRCAEYGSEVTPIKPVNPEIELHNDVHIEYQY